MMMMLKAFSVYQYCHSYRFNCFFYDSYACLYGVLWDKFIWLVTILSFDANIQNFLLKITPTLYCRQTVFFKEKSKNIKKRILISISSLYPVYFLCTFTTNVCCMSSLSIFFLNQKKIVTYFFFFFAD